MKIQDARVCVAATNKFLAGKRRGVSGIILLEEYIEKKAKRAVVVDEPLKTDPDIRPVATGGLVFTPARPLLLKFWDFCAAIYFGFEGFDIYFADEIVNFGAAFVLKLLGRAKVVVYIPGDHWLGRRGNLVKRWLFDKADAFAANRADVVLNSTFEDQRRREGKTKAIQMVMPNLCRPVVPENFKERTGFDFVYMGAIAKRFDVGLLVDAMELVPEGTLHIVGSGEDLERLKERSAGRRVVFHGFLDDDKVHDLFQKCRFGIASYARSEFSENLDSGKIRYYASEALPILVSRNAKESVNLVESFAAGMSFEHTPDGFAEGVKRMLQTDCIFREGCRRMAEHFDAERYFERLFSVILAAK